MCVCVCMRVRVRVCLCLCLSLWLICASLFFGWFTFSFFFLFFSSSLPLSISPSLSLSLPLSLSPSLFLSPSLPLFPSLDEGRVAAVRDSHGRTALGLAAEHGYFDIMGMLTTMGGALVNARDGQRLGEDTAVGTDLDEKNPFSEGNKEGNKEGGKGGGKEGKGGRGSAAGAGRRESAPPPSNLRVQSFASPLMWAASEGRPKIVAGLLAAGASIDSRDMEGYVL